MNRISEAEAEVLAKNGITSLQLISAKSGISENVALTKVTVPPGDSRTVTGIPGRSRSGSS